MLPGCASDGPFDFAQGKRQKRLHLGFPSGDLNH
jgi:hypothetical protein